jgi:hypothetical protein
MDEIVRIVQFYTISMGQWQFMELWEGGAN